ncbi:tail fiber protein [Bradyrhizobium sp. 186]|uniref:tail fiber protein n=1 Tax=Bradyrhizobium sp. 186 TaxID=2782654 RepID=UPI002000D28C|nr:tail fiber protein [Bradyrhizobium sp. 186]UPK31765.1 tail fiber protein [Bradyrhizobium sp. 186]
MGRVVFIDSRVANIHVLLVGLASDEQAFVIDGASDGFAQIAAFLATNALTGLSSISIVGHGAPGEIELGSSVIDDANLAGDAAALAVIGKSLASGGTLALYGCDTASGATGSQFISDLSAYAGGVTVEASTHPVGNADPVSWTLDASTAAGSAPVAAPFTEQALAHFDAALGVITVVPGAGGGFSGGGAPAALAPGLTVTDSASSTLQAAVVRITDFIAGDTLNFADQNNIHGSYDASHGILTLTGSDTVADYQAALRSITYSFSGNGDPTGGGTHQGRDISWVVSDGTHTNIDVSSQIDNDQPSLGLTQLVVLNGFYPSRDNDGTVDPGHIDMASIRTFAGNFAPGDTALADGQTLSIAQNTALFSLLGTTYGGNGQTTFQLPNLQATLAVGSENSNTFALGETYGTDHVTLTTSNLPSGLGAGSSVTNDQPSLAINYIINTGGPTAGSATHALDVAGEVVPFLGTFAPDGYLLAAGQVLSIAAYPNLFHALGTTFGGDGVTTFALPDLTGRTIVGTTTDGFGNSDFGTVLGQDSTTLTASNLPSPIGFSSDFTNYQPSVTLHYLIALNGIFPSQSGSTSSDTPYLGEVIAYAGDGSDLTDMLNRGWAECNGQLLSIGQNQALFSVLGTTYGGNGQINFALPNLDGRSVVSMGSNFEGNTASLGENYGTSSVTLTSSQVPLTVSTFGVTHTAPTVTAGASVTYAVGSAAVLLDSTLSVADPDSGGNLTGATIKIASGFISGDILNFSSQHAITGSYNTATGVLTLGGTDTLAHYQAALESITFNTPGATASGSRTIEWSVNDGASSNGTSNIATSTIDLVHVPVISSVTAATTGNATDLAAGKVVTITVNFTDAVNVTGTPTLQLNDNEVATYQGGSGGTALTFSYTVLAGDNSTDLQVQSLLLNGGTIKGSAGDDAVISNAATDLHLTIDTTTPVVSSISTGGSNPANATSETFVVTFPEGVTGVDAADFTIVTGGSVADTGIAVTPVSGSIYTVTVNGVSGDGTLGLNLNASATGIADLAGNAIAGGFTGQTYTIDHTAPAVTSIAASGSSPNHASSEQFVVTFSESVSGLTAADFALTTANTPGGPPLATTGISQIVGSGTTYTVTVGGVTGDGTLRLDFKNGSSGVTDTAGNGASAGFTSGDIHTIDHTAPAVSSITANGASPNNASSDQFTVTFSENVTGVDASDFAVTSTGNVADTGIVVTPVSGSVYTVTVNGVTGDGTLRLDLNASGTGISDSAGNAIPGGFTGGDVYTLQHTAPAVSSVIVPANGTYRSGQTLAFTVNFSEAVSVTGTPEIALTLDTGGVVKAQYLGQSSASALTFGYTVTVGENDANGIAVGSAIALNGGTIADAAGNAAVLTLNNVGATTGVRVDSIAPTVASIATSGTGIVAGSGDLNAGHTVTLTLNLSEAVNVDLTGGSPTMQLNDGGVATYASGSGTSALIFSYLVTAGQNTGDLAVDHVLLNAGTIRDLAGNDLTLPGGTINPTGTLQIDTHAPDIAAVSASPASGAVGAGQSVAITVAFGEAVSLSGGTPTLALNDNGIATYDAAATAALHDASKLVFDYTVGAGDTLTSALAVTGINLHGAGIIDLAGNAANLGNIATIFTGLAVIDSVVTANADTNQVVAGQTVTTDAAHGLLANDTDSNPADHVVVSAVDGLVGAVGQPVAGAYGSLTVHADGSYSYTANSGVSGAVFDNFTYTASNGHAAPSTSTLTVEVIGGNQNFVFVPAGGSATSGYGNTVLDGSAGGATITAAATFNAHEVLIGGPGDTLNAANFGQDTFVFAGAFGHNTINNFHPALDIIQLQTSQFGSLANVFADLHQVGADSVLTLDASHVVTITNTALANLTSANFHLV